MRKVKLEIEEKLTYRREVIIEIPDEMSAGDLEEIMDDVQRNFDSLEDFMNELIDNGINAPEGWDDDLSSPWDMEVECDGYEFISESKEESA